MKAVRFLGILGIFALAVSCASTGSVNPPDASVEAKALPFSTNRIYIANVNPPSVTVVDLNTFSDENPIVYPVYFKGIEDKQQSHLISVSKDGGYIWLSEDISKNAGYVQVVDARTFEILKTWDVGAGVGTHISHDGKWGFFASEKTTNPNINVFDIENQRYLGYIELGGWPHNFDTNAEGTRLYTTKYPGNVLYEYDISGLAAIAARTTTDQFGVKLPVNPLRSFESDGGTGCHGVLVHPNGKYLIFGSYTAGPGGSVIGSQAFDTFLDLTKENIVEVARIPGGNHNYEISPDRKYFFSSDWNAQSCNVEDYLKTLAAFKAANIKIDHPLLRYVDISTLDTDNPDYSTIKIVGYLDGKDLGYASNSPMSHQIYDPTGKYFFVTTIQLEDGSRGELLVLDGKSWQVLKSIPLPANPHGLSLPAYGR
jgi:DNA-binding beta-propeller fold protein YncE